MAMTELDLAVDFRGRYATPLAAMRLLEPFGGIECLAETRCKEAGFAELETRELARRGDLMLIDNPEGPTLGICEGARAAFAGQDGLIFRRIMDCHRVWRI